MNFLGIILTITHSLQYIHLSGHCNGRKADDLPNDRGDQCIDFGAHNELCCCRSDPGDL